MAKKKSSSKSSRSKNKKAGKTSGRSKPAPEPTVPELKADEPKAEEPKAEEAKAEEAKAEEPKAEEPKAEEPKAEEPKAEEPKAEEPKAEEPKAEEPKAEEPKADETKNETSAAVTAEAESSAVETSAVPNGDACEATVSEHTVSSEAPDAARMAELENELRGVLNFATIGVAVFAALFFGLLIVDTSPIPLSFKLVPKADVYAEASAKMERELAEAEANREKSIAAKRAPVFAAIEGLPHSVVAGLEHLIEETEHFNKAAWGRWAAQGLADSENEAAPSLLKTRKAERDKFLEEERGKFERDMRGQVFASAATPVGSRDDAAFTAALGKLKLGNPTAKVRELIELIIEQDDFYWSSRYGKAAALARKAKSSFPDEQKNVDVSYERRRRLIEPILLQYFGTPQNPTLNGKVSTAMLQQGERFYFRHCSHCHGTSGFGDGSTSRFLEPRPRNFTHGKFKFTSNKSATPSMKDLLRTVGQGVHGTAMPAFLLYDGEDVKAVGQYVKLLAIRGSVERRLIDLYNATDFEEAVEEDADEDTEDIRVKAHWVTNIIEPEFGKWDAAAEGTIKPTGKPKWLNSEVWSKVYSDDAAERSAAEKEMKALDTEFWAAVERVRSQKTFEANCSKCHGPSGAGDGPDVAGLKDDWGFPLRPANLTRGMFKGGRRPLDIYWRISTSIKGTPMPAFAGTLKEEQIWDLVAFVRSLSLKR